MHVRVRGMKVAGLATKNAVGPIANIVAVQDVTVISTPGAPRGMASAATSSAQLVGHAPSRMGVLFIIVTMCSQTASITPSVSRTYERAVCGCQLALICWYDLCMHHVVPHAPGTSQHAAN
jgi:hypothetical protein